MKTNHSLILISPAILLASAFSLIAQQPNPPQPQQPPPPPGLEKHPAEFHGPPPPARPRPLANLTREERQKLKAAREKALADPKVQEAREKKKEADEQFRKALHDAMLAADPSIDPILKKLEEARMKNRPLRHGRKDDDREPEPSEQGEQGEVK